MHTWFSHRASLSPNRSRQDRRDMGVSATVCKRLDRVQPSFPTGRPNPSGGPSTTGGTGVYPPRCGSGSILCIPSSPTGRLYPPSGSGSTGGTRVCPLPCRSGWMLCIPGSPTGRPYPPSGPGRTPGTRVYLAMCGRGWMLPTWRSSSYAYPPPTSGIFGIGAPERAETSFTP